MGDPEESVARKSDSKNARVYQSLLGFTSSTHSATLSLETANSIMLTASSAFSPIAPPKSLRIRWRPPSAAAAPPSPAVADKVMVRLKLKEGDRSDEGKGESRLYSVAPYHLLIAAGLPGAETVKSLFGPFVELVKTWNLPEWLVHWGHPGNMAVVLFAMGGYGTYLGFRIRLSKDVEEKAMAKDLHPKLLGGMFFFFALGATGGITALLTSDKPILESPHAVSGLMGLSLLTVQTILPALFEENPGLRAVHGLLGSSIMTLFLVHAALGLQLGLSF